MLRYFYSWNSDIVSTVSTVVFACMFENVDSLAVGELECFGRGKGRVAAGNAETVGLPHVVRTGAIAAVYLTPRLILN